MKPYKALHRKTLQAGFSQEYRCRACTVRLSWFAPAKIYIIGTSYPHGSTLKSEFTSFCTAQQAFKEQVKVLAHEELLETLANKLTGESEHVGVGVVGLGPGSMAYDCQNCRLAWMATGPIAYCPSCRPGVGGKW